MVQTIPDYNDVFGYDCTRNDMFFDFAHGQSTIWSYEKEKQTHKQLRYHEQFESNSFWLFCRNHTKSAYYIKHMKNSTYNLIRRFINSKHFNSNTQIKVISWQLILASWTIKLGKMFFCLKPVGMPRVLWNSLWEILILVLCNKIRNS